jgi:hypothetical protein
LECGFKGNSRAINLDVLNCLGSKVVLSAWQIGPSP